MVERNAKEMMMPAGFDANKTRKLTAEDVRQMREFYGQGVTQGALARHFHMSIGQVGRICRGESWQEGAGERQQTQAEADAMLGRILAVQARVNERKALEEKYGPGLAEELGAKSRREPPPMLTEGGDVPAEVEGTLTELQKRALEYGVDMDRLIKE